MPSLCTLTGVVYDQTGAVAVGARLTLTPLSVTGLLMSEHARTIRTNAAGEIKEIDGTPVIEVQGTTLSIVGDVLGFTTAVTVTIPSSATATLESLAAIITYPTTGLTVKEEGTALATLIGTINFVGTGVTAVQTSAGVATVTITGQPLDAELSALAGLTSAADSLPYFTGLGTAGLTTLTAYGRTLIGAVDASAGRSTLGLGTLATQNGTFSGTSSGTNTGDQSAASLGLVIGTDVQAWDADLDSVAALGTALQQIRVNAGGNALEYFTPAAAGVAWGGITGTLSDQTDLQTALDAKQPLDSQLTSIAALADASGVLTNDGAGVLSWAAGGGANAALSNLASVAINAALATGAGVTFAATSTIAAQITTALAGIPLTLTASAARAGSSVAGAAAGGSITLTAGAAARLTSGNANGGDITLTPGAGIGTGTTGQIILGGQLFRKSLGSATTLLNFERNADALSTLKIVDDGFGTATMTLGQGAGILTTSGGGLTVNSVSNFASWVNTLTLGGGGATATNIVATQTTNLTNTIQSLLDLVHNGGTSAAGFGGAIRFGLKSSTTNNQDAAQIAALWTDATHATRTADLVFYTVNSAAALAETVRFKATGQAVFRDGSASVPSITGASSTGTGIRFSGASAGVLVGVTVNTLAWSNTVVSLNGTTIFGFSSADPSVQPIDSGFDRFAAGVIVANGGTNATVGAVRGKQEVVAKTANYPIVIRDSGRVFTNAGAGAQVDFTLPTAASGLSYVFYVAAAQTLKVIAGASTTIRLAGSVSAAAGNITNATTGGCVRLTAISTTEWVAEYITGSWVIT